MKYEDLAKANKGIKTTSIKGKQYAEVNQRIKVFRMLYPEGFIRTTIMDDAGGRCVFKAEVGYNTQDGEIVLGTGHAYEKEDSTFINKTSYIENCETSAVGRALGMVGIGIDTAVASADDVQTAIANQGNKTTKKESKDIPVLIPTEQDKDSVATTDQIKQIEELCERDGVEEKLITLLYDIQEFDELTRVQAYSIVSSWDKVKAKAGK